MKKHRKNEQKIYISEIKSKKKNLEKRSEVEKGKKHHEVRHHKKMINKHNNK